MKKFLLYFLIIIIGAGLVYFFLDKYNKKDTGNGTVKKADRIIEEEEKVPNRDDFINEAKKLQTLAEDMNGTNICKCYNAKEVDPNTKLTGSILVYTSGDIFLSNLWLSDGHYIIDDSEIVSSGLVEESSETASIYCGEDSKDIQSRLCVQVD